jgi:hypothetical protein
VVHSRFDRRVLSDDAITLVRACQQHVHAPLGGGAALSAAFLSHRLSRDVDLLCDSVQDVRRLVASLPAVAGSTGASIRLVRDAGAFVRASVSCGASGFELDIIVEAAGRIEEEEPSVEGVAIVPLAELRASKITCILSRSEPRDLIDVMFLERAGFPLEADLANASRKDAGVDPAVLAWLLGQFPVRPLPAMLEPVTEAALRAFRDELRERLRRLAVPEEGSGVPRTAETK